MQMGTRQKQALLLYFKDLIFKTFFLAICMHVCLCVVMCYECGCPRRPEDAMELELRQLEDV